MASAQQWAYKMFGETTSHDFGTVARAAKSDYVFEMQNIYKETIHISGVRASCGCATPRIVKPTLETWEKGGHCRRVQYAELPGPTQGDDYGHDRPAVLR